MKEKISYFLIRIIIYPFSLLSYSRIQKLGKAIGSLGFYFMRSYRKRAQSNLALATDLSLSPKEIIRYAKESFQNLAINCLEYAKFASEKNLSNIIRCENPDTAEKLHNTGKGIIFFCGHQSNWEALFLDGTKRMNGMAIGKPIKNKILYDWVVSIRERFGGKIIHPKNALREGLRALKKGTFLGIVGDQGMPDSGYSFPFFGRKAWTSTAPAILSYKTNSPIMVATTKRKKGRYLIHYSDPLWPDLTKPLEEEVIRLMDAALFKLQESIQKSPGEWLWQHNRFKQHVSRTIYRPYRWDSIAIILPPEKEQFEKILPHLKTLKKIYSTDFLFLILPKAYLNYPLIECDEKIPYDDLKDTLLQDYRFKIVFNFTTYSKIKKHYLSLSAFHVLTINDLKTLAFPYRKGSSLSDIIKKALCRPGAL